MSAFWSFARGMGRYKGLIGLGLAAALLDATAAGSGFAALIALIKQLFSETTTVRQLALDWLNNETVVSWIGRHEHLAEWIPAGRFGGFAFVLGVILILAVFGSTMRYIHQMCAITVGLRVVMRVRMQAYHHLVHTPFEMLGAHGSADHLSRVVRDCASLARGFNALMAKAVRDILMGAVFLLIALIINWQLTGIFLIGAPFIYLAMRKFAKRIRRASKRAMSAYGGMTGAVQESMQGMAVVKTHNAEGYERRRFNAINKKVYKQEARARTARAMQSPIVELIAMAGFMIVTLVAAWYEFRPGGNPADIVSVLLMLGAAGASFKPLANLNNDLQEAAAAAERIQEMLQLPVETNKRGLEEDLPDLPRHRDAVTFENVGYAYPDAERDAVRGIDLDVEHGMTIAIVGPNGSGKSTLLNLLPRLIDPKAGVVSIDGVDIRHVSLRSLRRQIAVVTQQAVLFEGSIADNIAYGRRHASRDDVAAAAKAAFAHEFIEQLPGGYDAPLGEGGAGLSGGQKQRLCIARAILRDPAILILDEATSQVDADSEAKINRALAAFRADRTTFVIAHRMSTVVNADRIVVMVDGSIVDQGTHAELLHRCPTYQSLTQTQLGGDEAA